MNDKWKVEEWRSKIDFVFGMRRIVFTIQYNPIWLHTDSRSHICALTLTPTAHEHAHDASLLVGNVLAGSRFRQR